jgi:retron-type reverse transcriptase
MTSYGHPLDRALLSKSIYADILEQLILKHASLKGGLKKSPLIKDLNLEWISENRDFFINAIKNAIVKEDFEFSRMKRIDLNTNGKVREIYITNFADRILLMGIQNLISAELNNFHSPHLFSFRKGYGPKKAASLLSTFLKAQEEKKGETKQLFFIGRDVSSYGDSIDHAVMDEILDTIAELAKSNLILPLLKKSYRAEFYSGDDKEVASCLRTGIPSGSPVVPLLENIYLRDLDKELGDVADSFYARYGDDFIFLTSNEVVARDAIEKTNQIITKLKLTISQKKIKNYVLGGTKNYQDFQKRDFFEWIGITFYQDGMYSFRPKHKKEYKKKFRLETGNFTHHLSKSGLNSKQIVECLNLGFNEINDLKKIPDVQKLIVLRTHIQNTKDLDKDSREFLIRTMCKTLKITKREAWKLFRTMKLHSLEYQRRKLKCNKAA